MMPCLTDGQGRFYNVLLVGFIDCCQPKQYAFVVIGSMASVFPHGLLAPGFFRLLGALAWILRWLSLFLGARNTLPGHRVISGAN